jgi:hypothetical protein
VFLPSAFSPSDFSERKYHSFSAGPESLGYLVKNVEQEWENSSHSVEKARKQLCSCTVTLLVGVLVAIAVTSAGLMTWGIMFGVNNQGYTALSTSVQQAQSNFLLVAMNLHFSRLEFALHEMVEEVRVSLLKARNLGLELQDLDESYFLPTFLAPARLLHTNMYIGSRSGVFYGYGDFFADGNFFMAKTTAPETLSFFNVSDIGVAVSTTTMHAVLKYNASARPWFRDAIKYRGQVALSDPYAFNRDFVGTTLSFALYSELLQPSFERQLPGTSVPASASELLEFVVGVDVSLDAISGFLVSVRDATPGHTVIWIFDNQGNTVAISDPRISLSVEGALVQVVVLV